MEYPPDSKKMKFTVSPETMQELKRIQDWERESEPNKVQWCGPAPKTEQPSYHIVRIGPTDRKTYLASRRTNPLEHFWTKYRTNAAMYYPDKANQIVQEAKLLSNPFMTLGKELVKPNADG